MKVIVFKNNDGTCGIIYPTPKAIAGNLKLEQIAEKDVPDGLSWRICDIDKIPSDRTFRQAWTDKNNTDTVDVDIKKARNIKAEKMRILRNKKLEELDIETMRGRDVQPQKQVLRDLPSKFNLDSINDLEELKNYIPDELK